MLKTKKTVKKRFKITGSGKMLRRKQGNNHFMRRKSARQKKSLNLDHSIGKGFRKKLKNTILI